MMNRSKTMVNPSKTMVNPGKTMVIPGNTMVNYLKWINNYNSSSINVMSV
jgi:hypothetical protein